MKMFHRYIVDQLMLKDGIQVPKQGVCVTSENIMLRRHRTVCRNPRSKCHSKITSGIKQLVMIPCFVMMKQQLLK